MKKGFVRMNADIIAIVLFLMLIGTAFALNSPTAFYFAAAVAVGGYLIVQQPDAGSQPDERDRFLNHRSASASFAVTLTVVVSLTILSDHVEPIRELPVSDLLHGLMALMFLVYTGVYSVLKRRH